uniref:Integral membrane protein DGCR2/IDD n=2 Tax=Cacopsylla melanoneura TaxID=428564 RepID=A0A8D9EQN7_9HEMI
MEGQYCVDLLNNTVLPSKIYSPGPDPCTSCTCDNGAPTYCKVITCATPKNCRLVHPHTTCCNFECHENIDLTSVTLGGSSLPERVVSFNEITLRFVVIAFTVFVSMCLVAFLVHRLKKRKLRGRQTPRLGVEDNRIGYIEGSIRGSIRYLPEYVAYEPPHAALWKPHGYFPTGEAPPPYEEAVAAARAEAALQTRSLPSETPSLGIVSTVTMPYHRTIPLNLLSGNSHATTTTTAVIVRSNVHYDTLPQASQTNTIESNNNNNIRHPSLSRTPAVTSITSPPTLPSTESTPTLHTHHPIPSCHPASNSKQLELKSPASQPLPKPLNSVKPKSMPQGRDSTACLNNIYANVSSPAPVSYMGGVCKESKLSSQHGHSHSHTTDKSGHDKDRMGCKSSPHYAKCERGLEGSKYERGALERLSDGSKYERNMESSSKYERMSDGIKFESNSNKYERSLSDSAAKYERNPSDSCKATNKHDYIYLSTKSHEGDSRSRPNSLEHGQHSEHAHHSHKKHKKQMPHGSNTVQRNLTMPKTGKNSKNGIGKNLHTNHMALEKQYDQILKNTLKAPPSHPSTGHHDRRNHTSSNTRATVATISSSYGSHHTTIPNYFTAPPSSDVIKPPSIYKSSTTPTLLSHLSNSNPILSMSLDSNDEDYIEECENCRSDVIPSGDDARLADLETMTLQRSRPNCYEEFTEEKFASTSLTLPTHCRVQSSRPTAMPPVINRFSSILSQSSLSEEDD